MRLPTLALSLSLFGAALAACDDGTSTGNPTVDDGEGTTENGGRSHCKVVSTTDLALDADTGLGFHAGDVLSFVEGVHEETLTWYPQDIATYGPESGAQALTLTVTRKGAPRLTKYTADNSRGEEVGADCSDAVEVDVTVALHTAQGALDEQLPGKLAITSGLAATLHLAPNPKALGGSFHITEVRTAGYTLVQFFLDIQFTKFGTSGQLQPVFEMRSGGGVSASAGSRNPLAAWGPPDCMYGHAVPRSAKVLGFSADDALALLDATHGAKVTFQGAAASELSLTRFVPNGDFVCALLEDSIFNAGKALGTLTIYGKLGVKSADGRIDGSWPLELTAKPSASGALEQLKLSFDSSAQRGQTPLDSYGLHGIDVSAYNSASPSLMLSVAPNVPLSGELRVIGYKLPMCSTEVTTTPGGGVSTPACMGATPTDVARASITSAP